MTDAVAAAARAIEDAIYGEGGGLPLRQSCIDAARDAIAAYLAAVREPTGDVEVWRCPCCDQIVDRALMRAAGVREERG